MFLCPKKTYRLIGLGFFTGALFFQPLYAMDVLSSAPATNDQVQTQALQQASLADQVRFRGQWIQGGLVLASAPPNADITLDGQSVAQAPSGDFILGFGRDAPASQNLKIQWKGETYERTFDIQKKDWKIQRIEGISKKIMSPSKANQTRASQEAVLVREARTHLDLDRLDYLMGFEWPLIGRITGDFGRQRFYNGKPGRPHYGVDIAGPNGANVKAPAPGVVTLVHENMFYSGGTLIIDHGLGLSSTFIHLSRIDVEEGDTIQASQVVAGVGSTGRSTGPHLDWRINWLKKRLDPSLLVGPMPTIAKDASN